MLLNKYLAKKVSNKSKRETLFNQQGGLSPLTGLALTGVLERHHVDELHDGGARGIENQQLVRRTEHMAEHLRRAYDTSLSPEERRREIDTVMSRLSELSQPEIKEFNQMVELFTGVKVRFV